MLVITNTVTMPIMDVPVQYRILLFVFYVVLAVLTYQLSFRFLVNVIEGVKTAAGISLLIAFIALVIAFMLCFFPFVTMLPLYIHFIYILFLLAIIVVSLIFGR